MQLCRQTKLMQLLFKSGGCQILLCSTAPLHVLLTSA
jgi:hypothetical protein